MRQTFALPLPTAITSAACATASRRGLVLADGSGAVALGIDNRSGLWLQVYPGGRFVAPYTIGSVLAFGTEAPSVDVLYAPTGPAGQISSLGASDNVTVTLYDADEAPPADVGAPFVAGFTPILTWDTTNYFAKVGAGGPVVVIVPAVTGKRIRILSATFTYAIGTGSNVVGIDASNLVTGAVYWEPVNADQIVLAINGERPVDHRTYPGGLDAPVGASLSFNAVSSYGNTIVQCTGSYQVV